METRSILGGSKMRHFNERFDAFIVGLRCIAMELIMAPIVVALIFFDAITRKESIKTSFVARCLEPIRCSIKREVTWHYHPELDPFNRKLKGL